MKRILVSLVFVLFCVSLVSAVDYPSYTDKYVNDFASVLNSEQVAKLRGLFAGVDSDTTAEMVFVSDSDCASKGGGSQYAISLANYWKVGKADKNNGLIILYCPNESPTKRLFVQTGRGLEGILPDSKIGRLLDESYVPLRNEGNFTEGILSAVYLFSQIIEDNKDEVLSGQAGATQTSWTEFIPIIIWILLVIWIMAARKKAYQKSGKKAPSLWWIPILMPGRGSGSGGGGGGFSGGGFGGGSFGGGGAGR
jgi:uncharacterized protein